MNDPHVEALIYVIEHDSTVTYEDAKPVDIERSHFRLKVEDGRARFELTEHYATSGEARAAVQSFIDQWIFGVSLDLTSDQFGLRFERSEMIDRDPTPGATAISAHISSGVPTMRATIRVAKQYPHPPSEDAMDIRNCHVQRMFEQYMDYRAGQRLTVIAQVCCEEFETFRDELKGAAGRLEISHNVIREVRKIANNKGGHQARHASAINHPLTQYEVRFLEKAVVAMIIRAAKVAADPSQHMEEINVGNLMEISP